MKNKIIIITLLISTLMMGACKKNLLTQKDPNKIVADVYFTKVSDATKALMGVYLAGRECFYKPYAWDGASDMMYSRISSRPYSNYFAGNSFGGSVSRHWSDAYRCINRANNVIENVTKMEASGKFNTTDQNNLRRMKSEALFLRAITYFRMIDLWGDVPYRTKAIDYTDAIKANDDAYSETRISKAIIKDSIIADLGAAALNIPITVGRAEQGRITRAAVYGYRGKMKLYWACWEKNAGNTAEAQKYYQAAADDFAEVMKPAYGRKLYKDGAPGSATAPNYGEIFDGQHENEAYDSEVIFAFANGGPAFGTADGQSDEFYGDTYLYDFGTRSTGAGGTNVQPTIRLMNRYQLIATGDFAPALILSANNATTVAADRSKPNYAVNPASYVGRDYRMRATTMWDEETINEVNADGNVTATVLKLLYKTTTPPTQYLNAETNTGYIYRKYIRQMTGNFAREAGPQDSWMMRLPDVWLMYAEAVNEVSGPTAEAVALVNKIRARGALPDLKPAAYASPSAFFDAIEQERIIELAAEGHRFFDIRRWKKVEQIWTQPNGNPVRSTWGETPREEFKNATDRDFQRFYIFQIPTAEITKNPKITQNGPWL